MWSYRSRVERDLPRWREAGWVTDAGADGIRRELAQSGRGIGLSTALATLGAVLIGFAAMSFVAANWQDMPRLARLMLILLALWSSYGLAGVLASRDHRTFADDEPVGDDPATEHDGRQMETRTPALPEKRRRTRTPSKQKGPMDALDQSRLPAAP